MKPIRFSRHAREQCVERGAEEHEVIEAIIKGTQETAKKGRTLYRANFQYNKTWNNQYYSIKQVTPVILESDDEIVVITVYTFYF